MRLQRVRHDWATDASFHLSCGSVPKSCLTICDRGLQPARLPCLPPSPGVCSNSCRVGDAIQPSHPLLLLPSVFASIRVFSNEPAPHIRWAKYGSFHFRISPSSEYSGLIGLIRSFEHVQVIHTYWCVTLVFYLTSGSHEKQFYVLHPTHITDIFIWHEYSLKMIYIQWNDSFACNSEKIGRRVDKHRDSCYHHHSQDPEQSVTPTRAPTGSFLVSALSSLNAEKYSIPIILLFFRMSCK